ncbi:MAG: hypothetical protein BZY81_00080 [SAR202 cluster bacterium Io17-Chloro-G4]|nr:MAG: hypothetical protein BZY81_00080 [SAR202 cluster bacterium Io17-Chloro-G4]
MSPESSLESSHESWLGPEGNWDSFLSMAREAGLDADDAHMRELYDYIRVILPGLRAVDELDLTGVDPAMLYFPPKELLSQDTLEAGP